MYHFVPALISLGVVLQCSSELPGCSYHIKPQCSAQLSGGSCHNQPQCSAQAEGGPCHVPRLNITPQNNTRRYITWDFHISTIQHFNNMTVSALRLGYCWLCRTTCSCRIRALCGFIGAPVPSKARAGLNWLSSLVYETRQPLTVGSGQIWTNLVQN